MNINIKDVEQNHFDFLKENDKHINQKMLQSKIENKEIIVAMVEDKVIGWLRYGFFWDAIPFMNRLYFNEEYRRKGAGKKLVQHWETKMKKQGYKRVMTSTQSNEETQHFYRKLGYSDIGSFILPEEPSEIVFIKDLK
jgi:ribosomal protein S18 acetylase RimI-like enzyme